MKLFHTPAQLDWSGVPQLTFFVIDASMHVSNWKFSAESSALSPYLILSAGQLSKTINDERMMTWHTRCWSESLSTPSRPGLFPNEMARLIGTSRLRLKTEQRLNKEIHIIFDTIIQLMCAGVLLHTIELSVRVRRNLGTRFLLNIDCATQLRRSSYWRCISASARHFQHLITAYHRWTADHICRHSDFMTPLVNLASPLKQLFVSRLAFSTISKDILFYIRSKVN